MCRGRMPISPAVVRVKTNVALPVHSARSTATISTWSFVVGGLALVGGGLLYFTAPTGPSTTAQVRIAPRMASNGGGVGVEGTW